MAVAAPDPRLGISFLSNGGLNNDGGQIDLAAPGADVLSAWTTEEARYSTEGGTSVAVPFVAGVALLYAQAMSERCGRALQSLHLQNARRLPLPSRDVGMGLVQAP